MQLTITPSLDNERMRLKIKRMSQVVAASVCIIYTSILVWNSVTGSAQSQNALSKNPNMLAKHTLAQVRSWQKRAPSENVPDYENVVRVDNTAKRTLSPKLNTPFTRAYKKYVTHTAKSRTSHDGLNDIFISVKTTKGFHKSRLDVILKTWYSLARDQIHFFTDVDDKEYQQKTNQHMTNTNCSSSHNRKALCCKMSVEFDSFLDSGKKWFCHFDDDNYVNVPKLVELLAGYNPQQNWYLGKPSIRAPLEILNRDNLSQKISFWFATGGAGFCLSRALALKMMPLASGGKFISIGEKIRLPDDVTMGFIIEHLLHERLTVVEEFHSHLEPMRFIQQDNLEDQITFSYSQFGKEMNALNIDGFDTKVDPTRFLSLHCKLFPRFSFCPG